MTENDYRARVTKGVGLLDEKVPDWPSRITDELDLSSHTDCAAAQATGLGYVRAMEFLGLEYGPGAVEHGFSLSMEEVWVLRAERGLNPYTREHDTVIYAPLTEAWREAVRVRLHA